MTAYPRPAEREQIVVRLNSAAKAAASARPAPERPRACIPEVDQGACFEFSESRRTGNIEVTLKSPAARKVAAEESPRTSSPPLKAAPSALDARPKPHAGMPVPTGDFCEDLQSLDAEAPAAPQSGMMENLMAQGSVDPASESTRRGSGTPVFRVGVDVRLARIIDAWPRLSPRTRAAITAVLDDADPAEGPTAAVSQIAHRSLTVRATRRAEGQAKNPGAAGRRRSRKPAEEGDRG